MRELLILLVVIAVLVVIWYMRKGSAGGSAQRTVDPSRRIEGPEAGRISTTATAPPATSTRTAAPGLPDRGTGLFQEAADSAAGRLAGRASDALASIEAAASAHGGAVPGDGTHDCPTSYPIKGNMPSMRYHSPGQPSYNRTIPEVCFQSAEAAEAAGFLESGDEPGMRGDSVAVAEVATETVSVDEGEESIEVLVAEAIKIRDREDRERGDVVAEAIAATDAGDVPPGAVRGDGSRDCPPSYPIKGNQEGMIYHEPGTPAYLATIPDLCFSSAGAA